MDTNTDMIEEIEEVETTENNDDEFVDITKENINDKSDIVENEEKETVNDINEQEKTGEQETEETENEVILPSRNKKPIIIILSILLVLDIAALVIYLIGIDKVISFIK